MTERNYTTMEQSKVLIDLGIDPGTADMLWGFFYNGENYCVPNIRPFRDMRNNIPQGYTPAWSLTVLIKMLPDTIKVGEEYYTFSLTKNVIEYVGHDGQVLYSTGGECFVDAAVEMLSKIGG